MRDDLADVCMRVQGLRDAGQASREWPSILKALGRIRDRLKAMKSHLRRDPAMDQAADWFHRTLMDSGVIAADQRAEAMAIVAGIKALVGASVPTWSSAPMPRRRARAH